MIGFVDLRLCLLYSSFIIPDVKLSFIFHRNFVVRGS